MDDFLFKLQQLIAKNKIEEVIKILLNTFQKCESQHPESKSEIRGLRNQVVLLSARYNETNDKINSGIIDPVHAGTAKNQLISAFLNIIGKLPEYDGVSNYINGLEEEEAWQVAVRKNNIETYRVFFTKYPHGKYKEETRRIISEMETIEKSKQEEIKQKAAEEKNRRIEEEEKQKVESQLQKEKKRKDAEEQVKKANIELKKLESQKQKETVTSANNPLAASSFTSGMSSSVKGNARVDNLTNSSQSLFQKKNWPWFLLPVLNAMSAMYLAEDNDYALGFLFLLTFLYGLVAFKFPIRPKRYALISTMLSSVLFFGILTTFDRLVRIEWEVLYFTVFCYGVAALVTFYFLLSKLLFLK